MLPQAHPLRRLLPPDYNKGLSETHPPSDLTVAESPVKEQHAYVFDANETLTSPTLVSNTYRDGLNDGGYDEEEPLPMFSSPPPKPFSTPGPASAISRCLAPERQHFEILGTDMSYLPDSNDKKGGIAHAHETSLEPLSPELGSLLDHSVTYTEEWVSVNLPHCPDFTRDDADIRDGGLPNLYTAPGPNYHYARRPIYCASLTEDCLDSSLPSETYPSDINGLDFRWTPFNRKNPEPRRAQRNTVADVLREDIIEYDGRRELTHRIPSPHEDRFRFQVELDSTGNYTPQAVTKVLACTTGTHPEEPRPTTTDTPEAQLDRSPLCSRDSIESWSDLEKK